VGRQKGGGIGRNGKKRMGRKKDEGKGGIEGKREGREGG
jgi:hypothetical protein